MTNQEILEAIESMSLLQVKELVDELKEKFGVTGAIAVAGGPAAGAAAAAAEEEKTEFDLLPVLLPLLLKKKRPNSTSS